MSARFWRSFLVGLVVVAVVAALITLCAMIAAAIAPAYERVGLIPPACATVDPVRYPCFPAAPAAD